MINIENNELKRENEISLLKFGAVWCGPCRVIKPVIEAVENELSGKNIDFLDIDVDKNESLALDFGIRAVPTTIIMKGEEVIDFMTGVQSKEILIQKLQELS